MLAKRMSMKSTGQTASSFPPSMLRSPGLLFLLWAMWLASPYLLFGADSYCRWHDNADSLLALLQTNASVGVSGVGQWWNALIVGGQDALSSLQFPVLVQWLFIPIPGSLAYGLIMGCQRFLAGYFLYRLLRDELAVVPWAAVYGGLTYALFSQSAINDGWQGYNLLDGFSLPGIPATVWALARIDLQRRPSRWIAAAGLGVLVALGQTFPLAIFYFVGYFVWFAAVKPRKDLGFWALFVVFTIGWLLTAALPIWGSMLTAPLSQRTSWNVAIDPMGDENRYSRMALSLMRDNLLSIVLLSLGLIFRRFRDQRLNVLAVVIAGILVYVASYHFFLRTIIVRLGFLSGFQFSRVYLVLPFFCAAAGAAALPSILRGGEIRLLWRERLVAITSMAVPIGLFAIFLTFQRSAETQIQVLRNMLSGESYSVYYRNPQLLALARDNRDAPPFRVATICPSGPNSVHPAMLWAYGLATVDGYLQIYPKRYHRFWGKVIRNLMNTDPKTQVYFQNWGCRVYLFWTGPMEPDSEPARFSDLYNLDLLSLANVRFLVSPVPLDDDRLTLVHSNGEGSSDARGSAADQGKRFPRLRRFLRDGPEPLRLFIYENREVIPRVFLAHRTRLFEEREQLLSALADASREELASTALLLRDEADGIDLGRTSGVNDPTRVEVIQADRIVVSVSVSRPGILVVTQNYSPFWKVRVDGSEGRVIPVDHTFQGVSLEPGQHEVELTYRPPYALY